MHERLSRMRRPRPPARAAVVTGATGGIGEAIARALPDETALILTGRDGDKLALLRAEFGDRCTVVEADLATEAGLDAVAAAAEAGQADLLVNNAGLGTLGGFLDEPFAVRREALRVNAEAVLALTHAVVPGMLSRAELSDRRAGLVNVASSLAFVPVPRFATYAATKALVLSFSESLAAELADRPIDVLCACPGAVRTQFGERAGYGGPGVPGAMSPERVARAILAALGRQTTAVIGPVSGVSFGGVALARSLFGQGLMRASQVVDRMQNKS